MQNYLNNNLMLITEYQELYKGGISIEKLVDKFKTEELVTHTGFDYGRFRVFIDSCLLLLNKEKLNSYYKNNYSYKGFFDEISKDTELKDYLKFVKEERISADIDGRYLYYSLDGKKKSPWHQVATIRNAMAHMQYGYFISQESGFMVYYYLYNKDKGVRKDWGIVFESILHKFIQVFFSNYASGILFKNTLFSKYSFRKGRVTREFHYYEITCKSENMEIYNGYNMSLLSKLSHISHDLEKLVAFILEHKDELNIKEVPVKRITTISRYKKLAKKFKLSRKAEYFYGLKTVLDFETELSNFLVHIGHINNVLYEYCVIRDCRKFTASEIEEYKKQLEKAILELKEDENAKLIFEIGFTYLKVMNFAFRMEDDDSINLVYTDVDISMFTYTKEAFEKYSVNKNAEENSIQHYIMERMRNALMHGHIGVTISRKGEVIFAFSDVYHKREEKIGISLNNLKLFLSQKCLYSGVPQETWILAAEPTEPRRN